MRPEGNPLDLNNLPEDYLSRDGKQVFEDGSTGYRKKKSGGKDGKDECGKVYECRFCSLKFCKSQALGGHMNRHRQERETETLNRARQLVFSNDNLAAQGHLSCCHPMTPPGAGYHHPTANMGVVTDSALPMRFPTRMFSGSSSSNYAPSPPPPPPPAPQQVVQPSQPPYTLYNSSNRPMPFSSHYPPPPPPPHDYYVGHVLGSSTNSSSQYCHPNLTYASESSYTCIGAPVGHGFGSGSTGGSGRGGSTELAEPGGSRGCGGGRGGSSLQ
ncbi:zinc finger protein JAGGED-like isoform X2 [Humulus lupulus]|uniref:zinc finger protein JAGGED-like isoform X2 n=1 Tax=Humulus lupulus TaxID=3486 RepID=UPI002B4102C1|nr:zinc finger protein JAGGED-like isoform X2 [Humulus lupulus]